MRRSIRKYKDTKIEPESIDKLIESARLAPSGNNSQPWHYIIVTDEKIKSEIVRVSNNQTWMLGAPVFIVCVADIRVRLDSGEEIYLDEETASYELKRIIRDTAISIEHLVLEATSMGLGTCWVAWFTQKEMRPILGIPSDKYVVCVITVGYPDENPKQRKRKSMEDTIHYNKW